MTIVSGSAHGAVVDPSVWRFAGGGRGGPNRLLDHVAVVAAFADWAGREPLDLDVPTDIPLGRIVQVSVKGKSRRNKDGRVLLHIDGSRPAGWAQNWSNGSGVHRWRWGSDWDWSPAERASYRAHVETQRRKREADDAKVRSDARALAQRVWGSSVDADASHAYLVNKVVKPYGLRVTTCEWRLPCRDGGVLTIASGSLVVPARDAFGEIQTLEFIDVDGHKLFLPGGRKAGCWFSIGEYNGTVCVGEGYATMATVHEATGHAAAVSFDCGNLLSVAQSLRLLYPSARIIVCGDNDTHHPKKPGVVAATIAARAVGGYLAVPNA